MTVDHQDIRWKQRFNNFVRAYRSLEEAVELRKSRELNDLEKQGLIQRFEYTHELAWKLLKDYIEYQGASTEISISGSRDATRQAFNRGLVENGEIWMDMIVSRNLTSHTYEQALADEIVEKIARDYYPVMHALITEFTKRYDLE
jgi:nucleotidyltransferase substrate binding protein (TIGR01987 family)